MRTRLRTGWLFFVLLVVGCPAPESSKSESSPSALDSAKTQSAESQFEKSWAAYLAAHPEALKVLLDEAPKRGGWVKLYSRDYPAAEDAFKGATTVGGKIGLARAHLQDAELFSVAYELALDIERRYLALWNEYAEHVPKTAFFDYMVGLSALRSGNPTEALEALRRFRSSPDAGKSGMAAVAAVYEGAAAYAAGDKDAAETVWRDPSISTDPAAAALLTGIIAEVGPIAVIAVQVPDMAPADTTSRVLRARLWAQVQSGALETAETTRARIDPKASDYEEKVVLAEGPVTRRYYDLLVLKSLARLHARRALEALPDDPIADIYRNRARAVLGLAAEKPRDAPTFVDEKWLPIFLFSAYPTPADLSSACGDPTAKQGGVFGTYLAALGTLGPEPNEGKDTREAITLAQTYRDLGQKVVASQGNKEGADTVKGLKVVEGDMKQALRRRAGDFVERGRLIEALYILEQTVEKDDLKFDYLNDPLLFVEITRVYCAMGRYREALNYLYRLVEVRPELWLLQENLGDLSVLGTVDHAGRTGQGD